MAKLIYSVIMSLDGYVADKEGDFDWAEPDEEVHTFINDLERQIGTHLFGRRMYEVLAVWDTLELQDMPAYIGEYAEIWRAADKVVYSRTLESASTLRTQIERDFEPEEVRRMKASTERDLSIGGPTLAAQAFEAGLVDECLLFIAPVIVGGGKSAFPRGVRLQLALQEQRRFGNGMVYLNYRSVSDQVV
jgi:dihydrofolate reductase